MKKNISYLEDDDYDLDDDLPPELDLSQMEVVRRGPKPKTVTVPLDPDVAEFFKTPEEINEALRELMRERQGR